MYGKRTVQNIATIDWQKWVTGDQAKICNEWHEDFKITVLDSDVKKNNIAWILETDQVNRKAHPSYPGVNTQAQRTKHKEAQIRGLVLIRTGWGKILPHILQAHNSKTYDDASLAKNGEPFCCATECMLAIQTYCDPQDDHTQDKRRTEFENSINSFKGLQELNKEGLARFQLQMAETTATWRELSLQEDYQHREGDLVTKIKKAVKTYNLQMTEGHPQLKMQWNHFLTTLDNLQVKPTIIELYERIQLHARNAFRDIEAAGGTTKSSPNPGKRSNTVAFSTTNNDEVMCDLCDDPHADTKNCQRFKELKNQHQRQQLQGHPGPQGGYKSQGSRAYGRGNRGGVQFGGRGRGRGRGAGHQGGPRRPSTPHPFPSHDPTLQRFSSAPPRLSGTPQGSMGNYRGKPENFNPRFHIDKLPQPIQTRPWIPGPPPYVNYTASAPILQASQGQQPYPYVTFFGTTEPLIQQPEEDLKEHYNTSSDNSDSDGSERYDGSIVDSTNLSVSPNPPGLTDRSFNTEPVDQKDTPTLEKVVNLLHTIFGNSLNHTPIIPGSNNSYNDKLQTILSEAKVHTLTLHNLNSLNTKPTVLTIVKDVSDTGQLGKPTIIDTWTNGQLNKGVAYRLGSSVGLEQHQHGESTHYSILNITLPRPGDAQHRLREDSLHQKYFDACSKLTISATQGNIATQLVYTHILHNIQPADDALICNDFEALEALSGLSTLSIDDNMPLTDDNEFQKILSGLANLSVYSPYSWEIPTPIMTYSPSIDRPLHYTDPCTGPLFGMCLVCDALCTDLDTFSSHLQLHVGAALYKPDEMSVSRAAGKQPKSTRDKTSPYLKLHKTTFKNKAAKKKQTINIKSPPPAPQSSDMG